MIIPQNETLVFKLDRDFALDFTFKNKDGTLMAITDWEFKAQVKDKPKQDGTVLLELDINIDVSTSTISLSTTKEKINNLTQTIMYWDLPVTIDGFTENYIEGVVNLANSTTTV